jgi:hypothetical protein
MTPPLRRTVTRLAVALALATGFAAPARGQGVECLVYLKNGEVVHGRIPDRPPDASVTVAISGDAVRTFAMADIDSIITVRRLEPTVASPARALRPRSVVLGLSAGYSHGRSETGSETTGSSEDVAASASVEFFVVPGLALGVSAAVSHGTSNSTYSAPPAHGITATASTSWGIGPYVTYYLGAGRRTRKVAGSLYPYLAAGVHFGGGSDSTGAQYFAPGYGYVDFFATSFSGHSDFVEAGVMCMLADWAALTAGVSYTEESSRQRSASMSSIQPETALGSTRYVDVELGLRWFLY